MVDEKIHYDFVEIGTSDFDTLIQSCDENTIGLSIEPVKIYFDRLPLKTNVKKLNCAVSNINSELTCYWVDADDIIKYQLPNWIRGCGTINHQHPLVIQELASKNILDLYKSQKCEVISWSVLVERENIKSVSFLKIDAEGSDYDILESILNDVNSVIPNKIQFENKDFVDTNRLALILNKFSELGYSYKNIDMFNILLEKLNT